MSACSFATFYVIPTVRHPTSVPPLIEFHTVSKSYRSLVPRRIIPALADVSLTANRGEVLGIAGPNGAGKTTLLGLLLGFLRPDAGQVTVDGEDPRHHVEHHGAAYVPEIVSLPPWWSVRGTLRRFATLAGVPRAERDVRVEWALERLGLEEQRTKRCRQLSKGNLQRLGIAQSLLRDAELVVFDEPTHGLDPVWTQRFRGIVDTLRRPERAIVIASHNLDELERLADRVVILDRGCVSRIATHEPEVGDHAVEYHLVLVREHHAVAACFPSAEVVDRRREPTYRIRGSVAALNAGLERLIAAGAQVRAFFPARSRLEEAFREVVGEP